MWDQEHRCEYVIHDVIQKHTGEACGYDTADLEFDTGCSHCCRKIPWPEITFDMNIEEALALLETPNRSGVACLLARYNEFATKKISRVRLWSSLEKQPLTPNMLFHIDNMEVTDEVTVEELSDDTEKRGAWEAGDDGSTHRPVM